MKKDASQDNNFYILGWCCIGLAIGIVVLNDVFHMQLANLMPPCLFHKITGLYCLGCGGTRAVFALVRGDIIKSLFYHPMVPYVAIVGGWFMISQTIDRLLRHKFPSIDFAMHFRLVYLWIGVGLAVLNCLWKNGVLIITGVALM